MFRFKNNCAVFVDNQKHCPAADRDKQESGEVMISETESQVR